MTTVGDLLEEYRERPAEGETPEVLTLTEKNGFVRQAERFNKRLATEDTSKYKLVRRDSLAFNPYLLWAGAIARNTIVDQGVISPLYPTFRVREGRNPAWVSHLLLSEPMIARYDTISYGSVPRRRRSSVKDFLNLDIPGNIPPLDEQRRIVAVLDENSSLLEKCNRLLYLFEELKGELFSRMIERGDPAYLRYESLRVISHGKGSYGANLPSETYSNEKPRYIRITDIDGQGRLLGDPVSPKGGESDWGKYILSPGDLLFARSGATVGKAYMFRNDDGPAVHAGYLIRFKLDLEKVLPEYILGFTKSQMYKMWIESNMRTVAQPNINAKQYGDLMIPVVSLELQREYVRNISEVDALASRTLRRRKNIEELRSALQYRAFRGEL
ncbi:restriction endonuclease subunit S [Rothia kristinae]